MHRSRVSRLATIAGLTGLGCLAVGPLGLLVVNSVGRHWYWPALLPQEWSLRAWRYVASPEAGLIDALATSLMIALVVATLSVMVALPAGRALALHHVRYRRALVFVLLLPVLAPPLAATMGLHAVFLRLGLADSLAGVLLVHLVPAVPYATLMLAGSFANFDPLWESQARTLGAGSWSMWTRVTLPAVMPGIAVAAAFAFMISWSQYLLTLLIGGGRVITLPLFLVGFVRSGDEAVGAAVSLLFIAPTIVLFTVVARLLRET